MCGGPADLAGRRVGVRAYIQTTAMWPRSILADDYGVSAHHMRWVTFEDAHVAEIRDPPWAERAASRELLSMLRDSDLDAVVVGNDLPNDPGLRTVFPDPVAAAASFRRWHGLVPINHVVVVRRGLAQDHPEAVAELLPLVPGRQGRRPASSRWSQHPADAQGGAVAGGGARPALRVGPRPVAAPTRRRRAVGGAAGRRGGGMRDTLCGVGSAT